jgi:hypothetical protein
MRSRLGSFIRKSLERFSFKKLIEAEDEFGAAGPRRMVDPYLQYAWVNIAIGLLMRNIGRADFRITRDGEWVTSGPGYELFRDVDPELNRFDLWKQTGAWWFLEGEAFWFFGSEYTGETTASATACISITRCPGRTIREALRIPWRRQRRYMNMPATNATARSCWRRGLPCAVSDDLRGAS